MKKYENSNIKNLNTFGISSVTKSLIIIENYEDLRIIYKQGVFKTRFFILGEGSDVLFVNNFEGNLIKIELNGIEVIQENEQFITLNVLAGENWDDLVKFAVGKNYGGMENLSLIPGSVGASAVQNIGAYSIEAKDIIESVEYFDTTDGKLYILKNVECEFAYRSSIFKTKLLNKAIITSVVFKLNKLYSLNLTYPDILSSIENGNFNKENLSISQLRNIICNIRLSKLPYPQEAGNAGSFFKNPIISKSLFDNLAISYPDIKPNYLDPDNIKISASWLIEKAGWKGWTDKSGNYGVSKKHALVIVNYGNATGVEIYNLSLKIKEDIYDKFNITLEEEVVIVN